MNGFKVGDRVRVKDNHPSYVGLIGTVKTIIQIKTPYPIIVKLDGKREMDRFTADELEKIQ